VALSPPELVEELRSETETLRKAYAKSSKQAKKAGGRG
jgi:hypothetical protein